MNDFKYLNFFIPSLLVFFIILGVIIYPSEAITSAKEGLLIFTNILIPSLLPFIIGANLIIELKLVDIIGLIINPITKFIFNVSGKSALVFAISTVSGYPVGTKLASDLRLNNEISNSEAQRLVSFCSTSGPLFIIGAVSIGMFHNASLGYLMLICHYLGCICVGLIFRNYGEKIKDKSNSSLLDRIKKVVDTRSNNSDGFFVLFGNAVFNAVNTLLIVGGFVIAFSVIFKILSLFNIISILSSFLTFLLSPLGINKDLCVAFISGLFEITTGCNQISLVSNSSEILKVSLASFIIAFSGMSILAQCCNFIAKTDINVFIYIFSKFLHGIFSCIFTFLLYPFMKNYVSVSTFETSYMNGLLHSYYTNFNNLLPFIVCLYIFICLIYIQKSSK